MEKTVLRCTVCGTLVERLFASRVTLRSLSLGKEVRQGDLLCERCLEQLQEERSEEESLRGPA